MVNAGTWARGSDGERVYVAAGPVGPSEVRILPHAAGPGKGQGTRLKVLNHLHRRDKWLILPG